MSHSYDTTIEGLKRARFALDTAATPADRKAARDDLNRTVLAVFQEQQGMTKYEIAGHAGIAYSTVNDIIRRDRTAAPALPAFLSDEALGFDLMQNDEAARARRGRVYADDSEPCMFCGRKANAERGWWIRLATNGHLIAMDADEAEVEASGYDQGCFLVGPECGRKIPAAYRSH